MVIHKLTKSQQQYRRNKLKVKFAEMGIDRCERCKSVFMLTPAHLHKRLWYKKYPELLWDYKQVICLCTPCHMLIEGDEEMTNQLFERLR